MFLKVANLLAITWLALLTFPSTFTPAMALSAGHQHLNRQLPHGQVAKRTAAKRDNSKRCKPKSSSSSPTSTSVLSTATQAPSQTIVDVSSSTESVPTSSTSSQTPAPTSTSQSATSANGSGKIGLAWPNGPDSSLQYYATPSVGWIYSWGPSNPDPSHKYALEYMPMLWGTKQIEQFDQTVKAGYANYVLGFNEPNEVGQSNMDPTYAASVWKEHIEPKRALGYKTCSPATSSNPNGYTWVQNFLKACDGGCTFDMVCVHWYDVKFEDFQTYVEKWHDGFGKDIMITEFACQNFNGGAQPSDGEIWSFYQQAMPYIMNTPWIRAAFPFGFMPSMGNVNPADQLMNAGDGKPTALGAYIIGGKY
ncbi:glycosyl hydrolase catalytic core-domain-containing protein [Cytidiella melzeri]|nr:glycosyl hydrolase catalytic core-domain-containing protein [Cytidiella melzeri]